MGWYMAKTVKTNGVHPNDAYRQYLAYHEGHSGYARGSYNSKAWLQNVAAKVQRRADTYAEQLRYCP